MVDQVKVVEIGADVIEQARKFGNQIIPEQLMHGIIARLHRAGYRIIEIPDVTPDPEVAARRFLAARDLTGEPAND